MAAPIKFKYSVDTDVENSVEGFIMTKALTRCNGLVGSDLQDGGVPSEDW